AGRAGRQGPGVVYRCWPEHEHSTLPAYPEPEVRTAELTRLALELACWGTPDGSALEWWDEPPTGALAAGREVLRGLGALDASGAVTDRGRRMAELGLHPRLARALLDGSERAGTDIAAEVVALLDNDALTNDVDVTTALTGLRRGGPGSDRWRKEVRRLRSMVPAHRGNGDAALVVALAQPERLARRRDAESNVYLMASGTAVQLPTGSSVRGSEWLAIAVADRTPGSAHGTVRLAAPADEQLARAAAPALVSTTDEIGWVDGDVRAFRVERIGAIALNRRKISDPDPAELRRALLDGLREEGLELLNWSDDARRLRQRLGFLHDALGDPWPATDDESLLASVDDWLGPELGSARRRADLRIPAATALRRLIPWSVAGRLDELAPDRIEVPSGSRIKVDYTDRPTLPVKLQEVFGWTEAPRIADGRIPLVLHLLSPAGRPAAVTSDLKSFWANGYHQVRAELRGRYPKHPWPEDPTAATPTRRTKR
ncbi:ATP-dependent helicase C-terminal domain-containing protein, partial [Saccharopolyspora kobensis]